MFISMRIIAFCQVYNYSCARANVNLHKIWLIFNIVEGNIVCYPNSIIESQAD